MSGTVPSKRVLVLAPHGRDAELTVQLLTRGGSLAEKCASLDALCTELEIGAACAVVTIESLVAPCERLLAILAAQPPWSDFPFVILTAGAQARPHAPENLGNVTILERPVTGQTLLTAVRAALRARCRQYEARAAIEQRDQFLAMLGHELRNPLGAIVLASELAQLAPPGSSPMRHLATINRQAHHLSRLVDDLLDVARVTSGKITLQHGPIELTSIVAGCMAALDGFARDHAVMVELKPAPRMELDGDGVRLAQVVDNLLTNAIKYTPRGGLVQISIGSTATHCELHVVDTGIGISAEMLPRIFDLFAQVEGSIDRANGGMGIGLTLVKRLVELHDGTVDVSSDGLGHGADFVVRLPIRPALTTSVPQSACASAHAIRVVLIDDNEDVRELGRSVLEGLGCEVEVAADGRDGLAQILRVRPALALVDIGLPGMTGYEVAEQVRASLGDGVLLVAVTGYGQARDRDLALAAGFDVHLTKPVRIASFQEMVDRASRAA